MKQWWKQWWLHCAQIALILVLLSCLGMTAQTNIHSGYDAAKPLTEYVHKQWLTEDGLPQHSVLALCKSREGYIWIGTLEGVVRFDGVRFTVFDKQHHSGILSNDIMCIVQGRKGSIWTGTFGGGVSCYERGKWRSIPETKHASDGVVRALAEDSTGALWIGMNRGLYRLRGRTMENLTTQLSSEGYIVRSLVVDSFGVVWIGTTLGLFVYAQGSIRCVPLPLKSVGIRAMAMEKAPNEATSQIWIASEDEVCVFSLRDKALLSAQANTRLANVQIFSLPKRLYAPPIRTLHADAFGGLLIGNDAGVLRLYKGAFVRHGVSREQANVPVHAILQDEEYNIWLGTDGYGLHQLYQGTMTTLFDRYGSSSIITRSIFGGRNNALWVATNSFGVFCFNLTHDSFSLLQHYTQSNSKLLSNEVKVVLEDRRGAIWFGMNGGLSCLHNGKWRNYTIHDGLPSDRVQSLLETRRGDLWIGTLSGGVCLRTGGEIYMLNLEAFIGDQSKSAQLIRTKSPKNNTSLYQTPLTIYTLYEAKDSSVWVGTDQGIFRIHNGRCYYFSLDSGLIHNYIHSIAEDSNGTIWVGTVGGLSRLKNGRIQSISTTQGMYSDMIATLVEDKSGYFWIGCYKGIYRVKKQDIEDYMDGRRSNIQYQVFGRDDGMKSLECGSGVTPTVWQDNQGRLFFPTDAGVVRFHPDKIPFNAVPPKILIETLRLDSVSFSILSDTDIADTDIADTDSITPLPSKTFVINGKQPIMNVSPETRTLEINYTATSFLMPSKVQFRYMLEGYDAHWVEAGSRRVAYYTNLPRGRSYRFRVIACNNDGVWNQDGASMELYIQSFFWETWWAYIFYILTVSAVLIAMVRYREKAQRQRLQQKFRDREAALIFEKNILLEEANVELEETNARLATVNNQLASANKTLSEVNEEKTDILGVVAHDLKNPVIGIQKLAYSIENQARKAALPRLQESAAIIKHTAERMFAMIQQLLSVHTAEHGAQALTPARIDIKLLTEQLRRDWISRASQHDVKICVHASDECIFAFVDPFAFLQIMENLLSNAVKASPQHSSIDILLDYTAEQTRVQVKDTGSGLGKEQREFLFTKRLLLRANTLEEKPIDHHSSGLGLYIVKKLTDAMHGQIYYTSAPHQGAIFTLLFPQTVPPLSS